MWPRPARRGCARRARRRWRATLRHSSGETHRVLMENPHMGRTEHFTEVDFATPQPEGQIVTARITGHTETRLTAEV